MIFIATQDQKGKIIVFFSKNKKQLQEKGFKWIRKFDDEYRAISWVNESYLFNQKEFLY